MDGTVRRDERIDTVRSEQPGESRPPALRKLVGFRGCYVFADPEGVSTPISPPISPVQGGLS